MYALLLIAAFCGQFELELALALTAPQPEQESVIAEPKVQPAPAVQPPAKPVQQTRQETRTRKVWKKIGCYRDFRGRVQCKYGWVEEQYTVTVKVPVATKAAIPAKSGYPLRGNRWSGCNNWQHLTRGDHAGYFDPAWLQSLSWDELQSLHSDHHETLKYGVNKVHWDYVVRP